jgi:hypothetical protein
MLPLRVRLAGACAAAVALLMLGSAGLGAPELPQRCRDEAERGGGSLPLPYRPTASKDLVHLRVAGTRYAIPANYFRYPPIGCDTEERAFLLRVLLPTFEGWTTENKEAIEGARGKPWMGMNILLRALPDPSMMRAFVAYARGADPAGDYPYWRGLLQTKNVTGDDVFFRRENGKITFLMTCKTVEQVNYPTCTQHFPYRGARVLLRFARTILDDWNETREGTVTLLDRFVAAASR